MRATELRIGNIVRYKGSNEVVLTGSDFYEFYQDENYIDTHLKPILLTEKWLIRFGFTLKDKVNGGYTIKINYDHNDEYLYCSKRGTIAIYDAEKEDGPIFKLIIKYIHQLQNLYFGITGEDLKINL